MSDFRFQISDFRFQISDFRFQVSDFRFQAPIPDLNSQISDFRFQISDFKSSGRGLIADFLGAGGRAVWQKAKWRSQMLNAVQQMPGGADTNHTDFLRVGCEFCMML